MVSGGGDVGVPGELGVAAVRPWQTAETAADTGCLGMKARNKVKVSKVSEFAVEPRYEPKRLQTRHVHDSPCSSLVSSVTCKRSESSLALRGY